MLFVGYLVLGAFAGMLAGLFGIGGGLIIVPVLVLSFHAQGVAPEIITHLALGTSLPTMIFTGFSSLRAHQEAGAVDWGMIRRLGAGMLVGAWLGGMTANLLSASTLNIIIGCFAWTMALQMGLNLRPKAERHMPGPLGTGIAGTVIGWMSALFGIGGGSLTVPYLTWNSVPMRNAVAASAACSMPIALAGSLSYLICRLGRRRAARVERRIHLSAGPAWHRAHQHPVCPSGRQTGTQNVTPAAQAGLCPAHVAGGCQIHAL